MIRYSINCISSIFIIFIIVLIVLLLNKYSNNENFTNLNKTNNIYNNIITNNNIKSIKNNKNNRQTLFVASNPKNKKIFGIVGNFPNNSLDLDKQNLWNILELKYGENMASTVLSRKNSVPFLIDGNILNLKTYILIVYRNNNIYYYLHKIIRCVYKKFNNPNNPNNPELQFLNNSNNPNNPELQFLNNSNTSNNNNTENIIVDNPLLPYRIEDLYHNLQYKYGVPSYKISKLKFDIKRNMKLVTFALNNKIINNISKNNKNNKNKDKIKYSHFDLLEIDLLIDNGLYPYILEINKFNIQPDTISINDKINSIKKKILLDTLNKVELLNSYNNQFTLL